MSPTVLNCNLYEWTASVADPTLQKQLEDIFLNNAAVIVKRFNDINELGFVRKSDGGTIDSPLKMLTDECKVRNRAPTSEERELMDKLATAEMQFHTAIFIQSQQADGYLTESPELTDRKRICRTRLLDTYEDICRRLEVKKPEQYAARYMEALEKEISTKIKKHAALPGQHPDTRVEMPDNVSITPIFHR